MLFGYMLLKFSALLSELFCFGRSYKSFEFVFYLFIMQTMRNVTKRGA